MQEPLFQACQNICRHLLVPESLSGPGTGAGEIFQGLAHQTVPRYASREFQSRSKAHGRPATALVQASLSIFPLSVGLPDCPTLS